MASRLRAGPWLALFLFIGVVGLSAAAGASSDKAVDFIAESSFLADIACHILTVGPGGTETERRMREAEMRLK